MGKIYVLKYRFLIVGLRGMEKRELLIQLKEFNQKENFTAQDSEKMKVFAAYMLDIEELNFTLKTIISKMRERYFSHSDHILSQDHYIQDTNFMIEALHSCMDKA